MDENEAAIEAQKTRLREAFNLCRCGPDGIYNYSGPWHKKDCRFYATNSAQGQPEDE